MKEEGQEYGQVLKILGAGRVRVHCFDGKERLGLIRGKLRKKTWINCNDIVLIGLKGWGLGIFAKIFGCLGDFRDADPVFSHSNITQTSLSHEISKTTNVTFYRNTTPMKPEG